MPKLTHFEIPADHVERAVRFYSKVFDWFIQKDEATPEDYWLVTPKENEPEITAGIMKRTGPEDATVPTYEVSSVDGFTRRITDAGGIVYEEEPIVLPGIGYLHYCEDPEGNVFGIVQYDDRAV
jgi:predicted enzyme related to lactoylglutathione lyase